MRLRIIALDEVDDEHIMHYVNSVKKGRGVEEHIKEKGTPASSIPFRDQLNLYTYQFYEYWLNDYDMEDINFIVRQFPWLGKGTR